MKLLSDEWIAAEQENKALRDAAREAFWAELGVVRARDLDEIDLAPDARLGNMQALLSIAGNKIGDDEILYIAGLAAGQLEIMAPGTAPFAGISLPLRMADLAAPARSAFFSTDVVPTFLLTKIG